MTELDMMFAQQLQNQSQSILSEIETADSVFSKYYMGTNAPVQAPVASGNPFGQVKLNTPTEAPTAPTNDVDWGRLQANVPNEAPKFTPPSLTYSGNEAGQALVNDESYLQILKDSMDMAEELISAAEDEGNSMTPDEAIQLAMETMRSKYGR